MEKLKDPEGMTWYQAADANIKNLHEGVRKLNAAVRQLQEWGCELRSDHELLRAVVEGSRKPFDMKDLVKSAEGIAEEGPHYTVAELREKRMEYLVAHCDDPTDIGKFLEWL